MDTNLHGPRLDHDSRRRFRLLGPPKAEKCIVYALLELDDLFGCRVTSPSPSSFFSSYFQMTEWDFSVGFLGILLSV